MRRLWMLLPAAALALTACDSSCGGKGGGPDVPTSCVRTSPIEDGVTAPGTALCLGTAATLAVHPSRTEQVTGTVAGRDRGRARVPGGHRGHARVPAEGLRAGQAGDVLRAGQRHAGASVRPRHVRPRQPAAARRGPRDRQRRRASGRSRRTDASTTGSAAPGRRQNLDLRVPVYRKGAKPLAATYKFVQVGALREKPVFWPATDWAKDSWTPPASQPSRSAMAMRAPCVDRPE